MEAKKWYLSKTLWFNALAFVVLIAAQFGYTGEVSSDIQSFVAPAVLVINLLLRLVSKQALSR